MFSFGGLERGVRADFSRSRQCTNTVHVCMLKIILRQKWILNFDVMWYLQISVAKEKLIALSTCVRNAYLTQEVKFLLKNFGVIFFKISVILFVPFLKSRFWGFSEQKECEFIMSWRKKSFCPGLILECSLNCWCWHSLPNYVDFKIIQIYLCKQWELNLLYCFKQE